jgi:hypothetical protein
MSPSQQRPTPGSSRTAVGGTPVATQTSSTTDETALADTAGMSHTHARTGGKYGAKQH